MIIEKIPPLKCPKCQSSHVCKSKQTIICDNCKTSTNLKTGDVKPLDKNWHAPKGFIPKEKEDYDPQY